MSWTALIQQVLEDKKAENIRVLDVEGVFPFSDTLIVATGTSVRHLITLCSAIERASKEKGVRAIVQGKEDKTGWIVLSLPEIFIHLFLDEVRDTYQLEELWTKK